jgi:alpha-D-xyloside xylohydrolase
MKLVPYLHAAFVRYHREGLPPFRALVMDHPEDSRTWDVADEFMVGESLLVAPVVGEALERDVYLPEGEWYNFWTGQRHGGKQTLKVSAPLEQIPIFVKSGTLLPLAQPTLHTADPASYRLTAQLYGAGPAATSVFEDDGIAPASLAEVRLSWDAAAKSGSVHREGASGTPQYEVIEWKTIA